ncbi:MAG: S41 family peptidase [Phycisphaerales bacterium]
MLRRFVAPILFVAFLLILLLRIPDAMAGRSDAHEAFDPLIESRRILLDRFVDPIDEEDAFRAAIDGYIASLGDPYTQYVPPSAKEDFNKSLLGEYAGIGAEVNMVDGVFTIISPMAGSPALAGGMRAGDAVLAIDGTSIEGLETQAVIDRLTGPINSTVAVRVRHAGGDEADLTIQRRRIVTRTARGLVRDGEGWRWCIDPELGLTYVRLTQFNPASAEELARALKATEATRPTQGIILDLRDNPGGGLSTAIAVSDLFLDAGLIVRVAPRVGQAASYAARPGTVVDASVPIVVLVNGSSASASEIVAGSLQAAGRAHVLGTRSYGKGSVQEVRELQFGGGTLKYTIALYELANGRTIHRTDDAEDWGVDPDPGMVVPMSDAAYLRMLQARRPFEVISQSNAERDAAAAEDRAPACVAPDWARDTIGDAQLAAAIDALRERIVAGSWSETSILDPATVARSEELRRIAAARNEIVARLQELDERIAALRPDAADADPRVTLPEAEALANATIELRGEDGELLGRYRTDGRGLRRALEGVELSPATP